MRISFERNAHIVKLINYKLMKVTVDVVKNKNPKTQVMGVRGSFKSREIVEAGALLMDAFENTTFNEFEGEAAAKTLSKKARAKIAEGKTFHLPGLGSFSPVVKSEWAPDFEHFNAGKCKFSLKFTPDAELKAVLRGLEGVKDSKDDPANASSSEPSGNGGGNNGGGSEEIG